jgi:hypothetical protein
MATSSAATREATVNHDGLQKSCPSSSEPHRRRDDNGDFDGNRKKTAPTGDLPKNPIHCLKVLESKPEEPGAGSEFQARPPHIRNWRGLKLSVPHIRQGDAISFETGWYASDTPQLARRPTAFHGRSRPGNDDTARRGTPPARQL